MEIKAKFLINERTKLGLTQSELADLIGVSKNTISSLERGEFLPSINNIFKLCMIFHLENPADLFVVDGQAMSTVLFVNARS